MNRRIRALPIGPAAVRVAALAAILAAIPIVSDALPAHAGQSTAAVGSTVQVGSPVAVGSTVEVGLGVVGRVGGSQAHLLPVGDRMDSLVPVPRHGVSVELWSDPPAGSLVHPGDPARLYFRANADCFVTVVSVDTEGRVRMLFPSYNDDGWVGGGRTYRLPAARGGYDLRFSGPDGPEYVYALASLYPVRDRYPHWLVQGRVWDPDPWWWDDDCPVYETGWVIGDPFYRMRTFCHDLVPYPDWTDTYASAYLSFYVGRRVAHPRYVCSDCHWGHRIDPYGPACVAVRVDHPQIRFHGWVDFRVIFVPRYTYVVRPHWRPRHAPAHWEPGGRWVVSSADGHRKLREEFADAPGIWRAGGKVDAPANRGRDGDDRRDDRGDGRNGWTRNSRDGAGQQSHKDAQVETDRKGSRGSSGDSHGDPARERDRDARVQKEREKRARPQSANPAGGRGDRTIEAPRENLWGRAHEERLERSVRSRDRDAAQERNPTAGEERKPSAGEERRPSAGQERKPTPGVELKPAAGEERKPARGNETGTRRVESEKKERAEGKGAERGRQSR